MTTHPGMGVMIKTLSDNSETVEAMKTSLNKKIHAVKVVDNRLRIALGDGDGDAVDTLDIWDDGQSCCEHRYMHTDDDLAYFADATLMSVELRDGPDDPAASDVKESQFLIVTTSKGAFTVVNYNEHNGYYGGFAIAAKLEHAGSK